MSTSAESFDPSRRRLCPDGSCIGLLDENGRCRECGVQGGSAGPPGAPAPVAPPADLEEDAVEEAEPAEAAGDFDAGRRLCPDGTCLGVIGTDGRCAVCGQTEAEST